MLFCPTIHEYIANIELLLAHPRTPRDASLRERLEAQRRREQLGVLRAECCRLFAESHGSIVANTSFSPDQLAAGRHSRKGSDFGICGGLVEHVDHRECFRYPERPYRPAGLVAHLYNRDLEHHVAWADAVGLMCEGLEESWYYPGHALAAVYVPAVAHARARLTA